MRGWLKAALKAARAEKKRHADIWARVRDGTGEFSLKPRTPSKGTRRP